MEVAPWGRSPSRCEPGIASSPPLSSVEASIVGTASGDGDGVALLADALGDLVRLLRSVRPERFVARAQAREDLEAERVYERGFSRHRDGLRSATR